MLALGRPAEALKHYEAARVQAVLIEDRHGQARALDGAARALRGLGGRNAEAREHWQQSLALYAQLGIPQETQIRRMLAEMDLA